MWPKTRSSASGGRVAYGEGPEIGERVAYCQGPEIEERVAYKGPELDNPIGKGTGHPHLPWEFLTCLILYIKLL